jgi:hypothetical protein
MYGNSLAALAGGGGPPIGAPPGPPNPAAHGVGMGPPPGMGPGMPPPPTGIGAIPMGAGAGDNKKAAADQAILDLRELTSHFPSLGPMLSATIDAIKAASSTPAPPAPPAGGPTIPGGPSPEPVSLEDSGSPGDA